MGLHHVDPDELRREIVGREGLRFRWDDDPERGLRAIVEVVVNGQRLLAVLYPADNPMGDVYNLGSAYPYRI